MYKQRIEADEKESLLDWLISLPGTIFMAKEIIGSILMFLLGLILVILVLLGKA